MENLQRLLGLYRDDERIQQIVEALNRKTPSRILLKGLIGAQDSFVLSGTFHAQPRSHLYIAVDKEEAAYFQNNLSSLFDKKPIWFFPDSFKRPMYFEELNTSNVLQRTETINKITSSVSSGEIIVTYPEALFEKVVSAILL